MRDGVGARRAGDRGRPPAPSVCRGRATPPSTRSIEHLRGGTIASTEGPHRSCQGHVAGGGRIPRQAATWQRRSQTLILSIINSTQKMRSYISSPPDMLCGPEISFYNFYNGRA